jgi:type IV pilus assembly protein PilW
MKSQAGMTLIEIMISLLIGFFLLAGVLQIFSASQQTYRMQSNLSRLQENGRFALDFLAHDIRMAGYWGCLNGLNTDITGTDNNIVAGDSIDNGTDTIVLRAVLDLFILTPPLSCNTAANTQGSCCTTDPSLSANNCLLANLVNCYADTSSTVTYKINTSVLQQDTGVVGDLHGKHNGMVEGIQDMQIFYGEDTDMDCFTRKSPDYVPNYYVSANSVVNMCKVVSIRISLLAVTLDDNLTPQPIPYTYYVNNVLTNNIIPTDRKIRRVFNSTIALRNRLP